MVSVNHTQSAVATLRAITFRISSTPVKSLPQIVPKIAASLWSCKDLLSSAPESAKQGNESSITVHRFKTQLSSLLQDRTVEGRWSAVVLVKAAIEAGGDELLSKSNAWVRSLLGVLKKPDPCATRSMAVLCLTRIFTLTWEHSNLVREITTPALPAFISTCITNAEHQRCSASELLTILEAFATLIPRHPTIFRTNETQVRSLLVKIITPTNSGGDHDRHYSVIQRDAAQRLFLLLHHCAPKQGSGEAWDRMLKQIVHAAHTTCDHLLRSVVEDWKSSLPEQTVVSSHAILLGDVQLEIDDALQFAGWKGIHAGSARITVLLNLLQQHMENATASVVNVRLGLVSDLLTRLLALRVSNGKDGAYANNQISNDEREDLYSALPSVHTAAIDLLKTILDRFGSVVIALLQPLLIQTTWVFQAERHENELRASTYAAVTVAFDIQGQSMTREDITDVDSIISACCQDLLAPTEPGVTRGSTTNGVSGLQSTGNGNFKAMSSGLACRSEVYAAAHSLLLSTLTRLDPSRVSRKIRVLMERTAVMTQHQEALVACVLNPAMSAAGSSGSAQPSLLPLLARQFPNAPTVEAILRPRMPVLRPARMTAGNEDEDSDGMDQEGTVFDVEEHGPGDDEPTEEEGEPTDGLLYALRQQAMSGANADEHITAPSPHRQSGLDQSTAGMLNIQLPSDLRAEKRPAEATDDEETSAKRMRASPTTQLLTEMTESTRVEMADQPASSFVTAPEPSQDVAAPADAVMNAAVSGASDGSDSDDSEVSLTMEQDTDEESEAGRDTDD